jgi:hypothetical protein
VTEFAIRSQHHNSLIISAKVETMALVTQSRVIAGPRIGYAC